jgi:hypothetical protein
MIENCTLVYDTVQDKERYVKNTYVQMYPRIYLPVWVGNRRIYYGKSCVVKRCGVRT